MKDFAQQKWDAAVEADCHKIITLAMREDLHMPEGQDLTTAALVDEEMPGRAAVVAREAIVVAGLPAAKLVASEYGDGLEFIARVEDGDQVEPGTTIAEITGLASTLLTAERVMLNFLGKLSGIATQTQRYVAAIEGTNAHIYDTRKTTPGWRRLEKYAVCCGGGRNHRTGLYDAVLIKDNHLAFGIVANGDTGFTIATAVRKAFQFIREEPFAPEYGPALVEVEVDTLAQLATVLPEKPNIVLLDNMALEILAEAVTMRNAVATDVQLDASGGITIDNVRDVAQSGVERISIGALTHAARWVDIGLDWLS